MLTSAEIADIQTEVARTLGASSTVGIDVTLYRNGAALAAQSARLENASGTPGLSDRFQGSMGVTPRALLIGAADMNVQAGDRFNVDGVAYIVRSTRVVRLIQTIADCEGVQ